MSGIEDGASPMIHVRRIIESAIKIISATNYLMHALGALCLLILAGLTVVNTIFRYGGMPISWWFEVSLLLFLMSIFLCWGFTTRMGEHVQAVFILRRFPIRMQAILRMIYSMLSIGLFLLIVLGGVSFALRSFRLHEVTDMLSVPLYPFKLLIPLGALFVVFELLVYLIRRKS